MRLHNRKETETRRRHFRKEMTDAERVLWGALRKKQLSGRRFRRQHSIGAYVVDFYCRSENLVIEVDGEVHLDQDQMEHDRKRSLFLKTHGLKVLRFTNKEVYKNLHQVLIDIESLFKAD